MTGEWHEQLPVQTDEWAQVWMIGSRKQVNHMMNSICDNSPPISFGSTS